MQKEKSGKPLKNKKTRNHLNENRNKKTSLLQKLTPQKAEGRMMFAFLLNLFFAVFEVVGGLLTGSITILSDSLHDFCDSIALLFAFFMEHLSKRKPDAKYPFGYQRFSVISGLVNNLILIACSAFIIVNSFQSIFVKREINEGGMLLFAVFGIIVNGAAMLITAKGKNLNERTISVHMLEDVLTWGAVLIVSVVMFFFEVPALDSILSVIVAGIVLFSALSNLLKIFFLLVQRSPLTVAEQEKLLLLLKKIDEKVTEIKVYSQNGEVNDAQITLVIDRTIVWKEQKKTMEYLQKKAIKNGINQVDFVVKMR